MKSLIKGAAASVAIAFSTSALAVPITIEFSGTISASAYQGGAIPSLIGVNNSIQGEFRYDSETLFTPASSFGYNPGNDGISIAHYQHTSPQFGFDVTIGGQYSFGSDSANTNMFAQTVDNRNVANPNPIDRFGFWSRNNNTSITGTNISPNIQMFFYDYEASVFNGVNLPDLNTDWDKFDSIRGEISLPSNDPNSFFSTFTVTSFSVKETNSNQQQVAVSEPSGIILFSMGMLALILRRRKN